MRPHEPSGPGPVPGVASAGAAPLQLRLRSPADLLAAVPHLVGFRPAESLVLAAVVPAGDGRGRRLGAVLRTDLPAPADVPPVVSLCARRMGEQRPEEVALVVVGGGEPGPDGRPPRLDVAEEAATVLTAARVPVHQRLWAPQIVSGGSWRCYPPCGCVGTIPPVEHSPMAAASALLGQVTFSSRAELEATLAPDPGTDGLRRRDLVDRAHQAALLDRELAGSRAARRDLDALCHARAEVAAGQVLGDAELARLAVALTDPHVRDTCLGWAIDDAADAEHLWTALVRGVPAPEVAEPAVLLAMTLLVRGGGALVGVALERARAADPEHRLTRLVESMLAQGVGREAIRTVVIGSSREAAARLAA